MGRIAQLQIRAPCRGRATVTVPISRGAHQGWTDEPPGRWILPRVWAAIGRAERGSRDQADHAVWDRKGFSAPTAGSAPRVGAVPIDLGQTVLHVWRRAVAELTFATGAERGRARRQD